MPHDLHGSRTWGTRCDDAAQASVLRASILCDVFHGRRSETVAPTSVYVAVGACIRAHVRNRPRQGAVLCRLGSGKDRRGACQCLSTLRAQRSFETAQAPHRRGVVSALAESSDSVRLCRYLGHIKAKGTYRAPHSAKPEHTELAHTHPPSLPTHHR